LNLVRDDGSEQGFEMAHNLYGMSHRSNWRICFGLDILTERLERKRAFYHLLTEHGQDQHAVLRKGEDEQVVEVVWDAVGFVLSFRARMRCAGP
jgi:hypothetical protein